eukprot:ANDGO_05681.mRNA.1 hypothetical protein
MDPNFAPSQVLSYLQSHGIFDQLVSEGVLQIQAHDSYAFLKDSATRQVHNSAVFSAANSSSMSKQEIVRRLKEELMSSRLREQLTERVSRLFDTGQTAFARDRSGSIHSSAMYMSKVRTEVERAVDALAMRDQNRAIAQAGPVLFGDEITQSHGKESLKSEPNPYGVGVAAIALQSQLSSSGTASVVSSMKNLSPAHAASASSSTAVSSGSSAQVPQGSPAHGVDASTATAVPVASCTTQQSSTVELEKPQSSVLFGVSDSAESVEDKGATDGHSSDFSPSFSPSVLTFPRLVEKGCVLPFEELVVHSSGPAHVDNLNSVSSDQFIPVARLNKANYATACLVRDGKVRHFSTAEKLMVHVSTVLNWASTNSTEDLQNFVYFRKQVDGPVRRFRTVVEECSRQPDASNTTTLKRRLKDESEPVVSTQKPSESGESPDPGDERYPKRFRRKKEFAD